MKRKLGWKRDPADKRDLDFVGLQLPTATPDVVNMIRHWPAPYDQLNSNTCVGNGLSGAIAVAERQAGVNLADKPSRLAIYYNGRRFTSGSWVLRDDGAIIRDAATALAKVGACDEATWSFSDSPLKVNRRPSWEACMRGLPRAGGEYRRIFAAGTERAHAVQAALAAGLPVVFGMLVGESFLDSVGPSIVGVPHDPIAGGHCMFLDGYDKLRDANGTLYHCENSWGAAWRAGGSCWLTEELLCNDLVSDCWIVRGWHAVRDRGGIHALAA